MKATPSSSDFISSISHELKTPLNAIIGFAEILQDHLQEQLGEKMKNSKQVSLEDFNSIISEAIEYVKEITLVASDMNELIHDLLDVSSSSSGNFSIDLSKEIDIAEVIKRSVKINYDFALRRGISIKVEIDDNLQDQTLRQAQGDSLENNSLHCHPALVAGSGKIHLDAKRMKQIITNLISNAIKYSPEKTEVKINVSIITPHEVITTPHEAITTPHEVITTPHPNPLPQGERGDILQITISDQGFGMTESQIQSVFEKDKIMPDNPNRGKVDSFGLGLPITKQLVELQHGRIEMRSGVNEGTEVILEFPYLM